MPKDPRGRPFVVIGDPILFWPEGKDQHRGDAGGLMRSLHPGRIYWEKEYPLSTVWRDVFANLIERGCLVEVKLRQSKTQR